MDGKRIKIFLVNKFQYSGVELKRNAFSIHIIDDKDGKDREILLSSVATIEVTGSVEDA